MSTTPSGGSILLKTMGFSLFLTLVFSLVSNLLPQVEGEAPVEQKVDLSALTMDDFVALGETLFMGKGTCTLCHKPPPIGRAPDIQGTDMVATSKERLADERYQGDATDSAGYLHESLVTPSKYVVATWGKKGSNDTESPMPAVDKPPIQLSAIEIDAIIAYLQAKDGNEVTIALPSPEAASEATAAASPATTGGALTPATAEEAISKHACQACHTLLGSSATVGPPLDDIGDRQDRDQMRSSIVDPNAQIAQGYTAGVMPTDFGDKMTVKELEMILTLLESQKK